MAQEVAWLNPGGGSFSQPSNWQGNQVPGPAQVALFDLDSTYSVSVGGDATLGGITFRRGTPALNLQACTITLGASDASPGNLVVGGPNNATATAQFSGGSVRVRVGGQVRVGTEANTSGVLVLNGAATRMPMSGRVFVGGAGEGQLSVTGGAILSDTLPGAAPFGVIELADGSAVVADGAGSLINIKTFLAAGGDIQIRNGGRINADVWNVGNANVTVSDPNSRLTWENGYTSTGALQITNGATATGLGTSVTSPLLSVQGAGSAFSAPQFNGNAFLTAGGAATSSFVGLVTASGAGTVLNLTALTGTADVSGGARVNFESLDSAGLIVRGAGTTANAGFAFLGFGGQPATVSIREGASMAADVLVARNGSRFEVLSGSTATIGQTFSTAEGEDTSTIYVAPGGLLTTTSMEVGANNSTAQYGGHAIIDGALTVTGASMRVTPHGHLSGGGVVSGIVFNEGLVTPGSSAGRLSILGSFTQASTGILEIELLGVAEGSGYDVLDVSGAVSLGGTLNIEIGPGFTLVPGEVFSIIHASSISGSFNAISVTNLPSNLTLDFNYAATAVTVTVVPAPGVALALVAGLLAARRRR